MPTDTVYGVAAALNKPEAVRRIFATKHRSFDKPLPVLVGGWEDAAGLGRFSAQAEEAARAGWPGALTVVVPSVRPLPQLGGDGVSVGLRVPDHPFALLLLKRCGPLAATSANLSGRPEAHSIEEASRDLGDEADLYIDGGVLASSPSRVISFVGDVRVLRQ